MEFMNASIQRSNDFECLNELFQFLSRNHETFYTPWQLNKRRVVRLTENWDIIIVKNNTNNSNELRYIDSVHSLCVEITVVLNSVTNRKKKNGSH